MSGDSKGPWYFSPVWVIALLLSIGPLGLPLLWLSPRFSKAWKWILTMLIAALTWGLVAGCLKLIPYVKNLLDVVRQSYPELRSFM